MAFTQARAAPTPVANPAFTTTAGAAMAAAITGASSDEAVTRLNAALEGRYLVERELGRGGMATVYLARDVRHDREVAIKVLLPELSASIGGERFEREIKLAAKLQHPHILGLFDSGSALGLLYYVMPFVKGESLRDRLDREGQLPVDDAIVVALEVADALGHAHEHGIIHRDIKPENIMLSGGHALVADFGIARAATEAGAQKLTQTGMAVGTPVYMSPEQAGGETVTPAADLYSLGCVLYEMLAGEPPFTGKSPMQIMARHAMEQVPSIRIVRSSVPEEVEAAIFAAMGKVPADRPQTAAQFSEMLGVPAMGSTASMRSLTPTATRRVPSGNQGAYQRTPQFTLAMPPPVPVWRRPAVIVGGVALLAAGVAGALYASKRGGPATTDPNSRRVAVLYFTDASKEKDLGPLADGLTEGLIHSLGNASTITVISRAGVERYRESSLAPDSIARALRAGYLVRGDVEHEGANVRVNVRLDDGSGANIDKKSFRVPASNPLAMQDTLAQRASDLIHRQLGQEIQVQSERARTPSQEAWLMLQRGEQARRRADELAAKGDTASVDKTIAEADSMLAEAAKDDPKWSEPITRRALLAYGRSRAKGMDPGTVRKWIDIGVKHADRAIALDPRSGDALEVRGNLKYWSWFSNLETDAATKEALLLEAKVDLENATTVNPKQAGAFASLASLHYQVPSSTTSDVVINAQRAYDADEFLANANTVLNRLFLGNYDLGSFDKANQHCKIFISRFPGDVRAKRCRLFLLTLPKAAPSIPEAWRIADSVVAMSAPQAQPFERFSTNMLVAAAIARASTQNAPLADSARRLAKHSEGNPQVDPRRDLTYYGAFVYTILGDANDAVRMLKEYLAVNPQRTRSLRGDPGWWFKDLQNNPEFKQLVGTK